MSTMAFDEQHYAQRPLERRGVRPVRRRSTVRLTRRGRVVVFGAGLAALLGGGFAISNGAGAALHSGKPESTHLVVVAPGDTLWDFASEVTHGGDVRSMIAHIEEINGLSGVSLSAGQTLRIPD